MSYPTSEQYNEVLQHPHLSLLDPALKTGVVATTGLGLPLVLSGNFALTYTITTSSGKKYAVRCFKNELNAREHRYQAISDQIKSLNSNYFLEFEFQPKGIRINKQEFPIVKMAWAAGSTLGVFLETRYRNKQTIQQLRGSIQKLASYLKSQRIAHGDIQLENVMVAQEGKVIQLIDYDGMFVDSLKNTGSSEMGHRNFQHPQRNSAWDLSLDRFSFITLHFSLYILENRPEMWIETQSGGEAIIFKANDFADPDNSKVFKKLLSLPEFVKDTKNFIAICKGSFNQIPSFEDFINQCNIPQFSNQIRAGITGYISSYQVLDASKYALCLNNVGDKVELIGKVIQVTKNYAKNNKPYIFINFGDWRGQCVKLCIWSEGLDTFQQHPDQNWNGKWISAIGLIEPPYSGKGYIHLSINITQANQIHIITETEAKFRLLPNTETIKIIEPIIVAKPITSTTASPTVLNSNKDIIEKMERERVAKVEQKNLNFLLLARVELERLERERLERERVARVERERLERERLERERLERERLERERLERERVAKVEPKKVGFFGRLFGKR